MLQQEVGDDLSVCVLNLLLQVNLKSDKAMWSKGHATL